MKVSSIKASFGNRAFSLLIEVEGKSNADANIVDAYRATIKHMQETLNLYAKGQSGKCPHGHEDWGDCPVCGH